MHFRSSFARASILTLGLTVGLGAAAGCGRYSINNLRSVKAFKDGTEAYKKSDFVKAAEQFQASITYNGDQGIVYFYLANSFDQQFKPSHKGEAVNDGYMKKAVENYQKAIDKLSETTSPDPKIQEGNDKFKRYSYEYMIAAYGPDKLDDFAKAEPIAKKLIELTPNDPVNFQALGKLYEDQGRYDEAEEQFKKAVSAKPTEPGVYTAIAGYYNRQGKFDETMKALESRTKYEPNNPEAYHYMATFYQDKVQKDFRLPAPQKKAYILKGLEVEDKALALNPNYVEAMVYKNILLRQQATVEKDPGVQKRLIEEADSLRNKAMDLQKKANASAGSGAAKDAKDAKDGKGGAGKDGDKDK
jgi:tetratricopeptide (TPR) repeat protein